MGPDFTVIKGGKKPEETKQDMSPEQQLQRLNNLKMFMKSLEAHMASINKQSKQLNIPKLENKVNETHKAIVQVLRVVKEESKKIPSGSLNDILKKKFKLVKDRVITEPEKDQ